MFSGSKSSFRPLKNYFKGVRTHPLRYYTQGKPSPKPSSAGKILALFAGLGLTGLTLYYSNFLKVSVYKEKIDHIPINWDDVKLSGKAKALLASGGQDNLKLAQQLVEDAKLCQDAWNVEEGIKMLEHAKLIYENMLGSEVKEIADVHFELGNSYFLMNTIYPSDKLEQARDSFQKAEKIYSKMGYFEDQFNAKEMLALTYRTNPEEAEKMFEEIINERKERFKDNDPEIVRTYLRLAGVYRSHVKATQYHKYMKLYKEALAKYEDRLSNKIKVDVLGEKVNHALTSVLNPGGFEEVIESFYDLNKVYLSLNKVREIALNRIPVAMLYLQKGMPEDCLIECKKFLDLGQSFELPKNYFQEIYRIMIQAYGLLNNLKGLETYEKKLKELEDSKDFWISSKN